MYLFTMKKNTESFVLFCWNRKLISVASPAFPVEPLPLRSTGKLKENMTFKKNLTIF